MSKFMIVTDSSADLSQEMVEKLNIQVLPLSFTMGDSIYHNYHDNREIAPQEVYARLRGGEMAQTSAVNVADYVQRLDPMMAQGQDVLILSFSSALSSTYQSAVVAAEDLSERHPQRKIFVVDTRCASVGQGLLVTLAAQKRDQGATLEELRDWAEDAKNKICHQFTVDDLQFLKRGGRISGATATVGTMLAIKPLLTVDGAGTLQTVGKARGRNTAMKQMVERMAERAVSPGESPIFIGHGDCLEEANQLAELVKARFGQVDIRTSYVGPVIGVHTGPGVLVLCYLGTQR